MGRKLQPVRVVTGVGLGVLAELMEEEVVDVVGPRSKPDSARLAYRHGHEPGEVVLGGNPRTRLGYLDNGSVPSADRIHAELQEISAGDLMAWTPKAVEGFFVAEIEPERALVLHGDAGGLYRVTWAFVLEPVEARTTRLLTRASGDYERRSVGLRLHLIGRPMHFATQRKQLLNLRKRTEAASASASGS